MAKLWPGHDSGIHTHTHTHTHTHGHFISWRGHKKYVENLVTVTYFLFSSAILLQFVCIKITYLNNFK